MSPAARIEYSVDGSQPQMSSFIPDGEQGLEGDRLGKMVDATPEQVTNPRG
jgi:hypothetical protein